MTDTGGRGPRLAAGLILAVAVLTGPWSGLDPAADPVTLGDGTASVEVVEPTDGPLYVTPGRFGTGVDYLRVPDLVVDVDRLDGRPRVYYELTVPDLGVRRNNYRVVTSPGRLRVPLSDRALARGTSLENTTARVVVRVQSFTQGRTVYNRTVEVRGR